MNKAREDRLWEIYMEGFNDCPSNINNQDNYKNLEKKAYITGWDDYIIGDGIETVDRESKKETVNSIIIKSYLREVAETLEGRDLFPKKTENAKEFLRKIKK